MAAPTTTRKNIRQKAVKKLYAHHFPIVSITTGAGSTTSLVDAVLGPAAQTEDYIGAWVYIAEAGGGGTPAIGEISRVTNFTPSTNTLTLSPALSDMESGLDYELHFKFHPSQVHEKLNELLENMRRPIEVPLTLVSDGDMENDPDTNFTASSATLLNDATVVRRGRRSLKVTATGANGQARSANIDLPPSTPVLVATEAYITVGDAAKLILWDVTNSAEIESAVSTQTGWGVMQFTVTTPATCEQVMVRLEATNNTDVVYFNSAILLPVRDREFAYPATLEFHEDFTELFEVRHGDSIGLAGNEFAYRSGEGKRDRVLSASFDRDDTAVVPYRIRLPDDFTITSPIYVSGRVDYATLSDDIATTTAPEDIIVDLLFAQLLDDMAAEALDADNFNKYNALVGKALSIRRALLPRMAQFTPSRGEVVGARRG